MPGDSGGPTWQSLILQATPRRRGAPELAAEGVLTVREALAKAYGPSYADQKTAGGRIKPKFGREIAGKPSGGAAVSRWTEHARDLRRVADLIEEILGSEAAWDSTEDTYIRLRDALIARVAETADHTSQPKRMRRVHKALQTYIRATRLVAKAYASDETISRTAKPLTLERWRKDLNAAWTAQQLPLPRAKQPRYDPADAAKIYKEGTSGRYDPRYALWLLLGMEGRPGQVLEARRSDLEDNHPGTVRGRFYQKGTELKHGLAYAPTPAHRLAIDEHLNEGYLREYERRFRSGAIKDYPLFPGGRLVDRVAPFREKVRPWSYRSFLGDPHDRTGFYQIEGAAGVAPDPGRGPYALKYTIADLAPIVAGRLGIRDAAAVNLVTGHDTPGTATLYRQDLRSQPAVLIAVGRIIWAIRREFMELAQAKDIGSEIGAGQVITRFRVQDEGVAITTHSGKHVWVPWAALVAAGQDADAVRILAETGGTYTEAEVDEQAKSIHFVGLGVRVDIDTMVQRAIKNVEHQEYDAVLRPAPRMA